MGWVFSCEIQRPINDALLFLWPELIRVEKWQALTVCRFPFLDRLFGLATAAVTIEKGALLQKVRAGQNLKNPAPPYPKRPTKDSVRADSAEGACAG